MKSPHKITESHTNLTQKVKRRSFFNRRHTAAILTASVCVFINSDQADAQPSVGIRQLRPILVDTHLPDTPPAETPTHLSGNPSPPANSTAISTRSNLGTHPSSQANRERIKHITAPVLNLEQVPSESYQPVGQKKEENTSVSVSQSSFLPALKPIGSIQIDIAPKSRGSVSDVPKSQVDSAIGSIATIYPSMVSPDENVFKLANRNASDVPYKPLYFEEVNLERYGHTCGFVQPALSGARFLATIPTVPYTMTVYKGNQPYYWQWPYPAGTNAPRVRELPNLSHP